MRSKPHAPSESARILREAADALCLLGSGLVEDIMRLGGLAATESGRQRELGRAFGRVEVTLEKMGLFLQQAQDALERDESLRGT